MLYLNETAVLTNESIKELTEKSVEAYKKAAGKRAASLVKLSLAVEEILLDFREAYGSDTPCTVRVNKSFGKIVIAFRQKGAQINPVTEDDAEDNIAHNILVSMDLLPKYSFDSRSGFNTVSLTAEQKPQKNKSARQILAAVVLAVICYFLIGLLPETAQAAIAEDVITPVFNKLTFVITAVATPLVFFAVVNGIAEIGDIQSLGSIGKRYLSEVMLTYLIAGVTFTTLAALAYGIDLKSTGTGSGFLGQTIQLVLDIVPNNLLSPFTTDNDLQVVVVAILIGVSLLGLHKKAEPIKEAFSVIGDLINQMMTIVFKLIPAIVFIGVLNILCSSMEGIGKLYIMVLLFLVSAAIVVLYITLRTCATMKVPFSVFFKKQLPTTMINLTTSSQVSALPENIICCKEKFGISGKLVDFGLPLGIVIYMPNGACFLGLTVWALADMAGKPLSAFSMVIVLIMAVVIAIAAPPIPGSALTVIPIMLSICEIPLEYYPIAIILGTLVGYFLPLLNGYCLQLQMVLIANDLDMIDTDVLRKPVEE